MASDDFTPTRVAFLKNLSNEFLTELAIGTSSYDTLCDKYMVDGETREALRESEALARMVSVVESKVEVSEEAFRRRNALVASETLQELRRAALDPQTPSSLKLSIYREVSRLGGMDPKPAAVQAGPGFSIQINFPPGFNAAQAQADKMRTVDAEPKITVPVASLGDPPSYFAAAGNSDLMLGLEDYHDGA